MSLTFWDAVVLSLSFNALYVFIVQPLSNWVLKRVSHDSLRNQLAGNALTGLLAAPSTDGWTNTKFADVSYLIADSMIKRSKE